MAHNANGRNSRPVSLVLALFLILSLFPLTNPAAAGAAEGSGSIGNVSDETLRRLGFDVDSAGIKAIMGNTSPDAQPLGYGANSFCLLPMDDLFIRKSDYNKGYVYQDTFLMGKMDLGASQSNGPFLWAEDAIDRPLASAQVPDSDMSRSVAFDPTGSGSSSPSGLNPSPSPSPAPGEDFATVDTAGTLGGGMHCRVLGEQMGLGFPGRDFPAEQHNNTRRVCRHPEPHDGQTRRSGRSAAGRAILSRP